MKTLRALLVPALFAASLALPARADSEGAEAPAPEAEKPAAPQAPQMSSRLQAAKRLYQKLDLDAAMAELKEAEQDAKAKDNEEELVMVLIYKGLIYADQGKATDMSDHFKRALAMRPWTEMPPETSPRIAKQFADSRRELWGSPLRAPPKKKKVAAAPAPVAPPAAPAAAPAPKESPATPKDSATTPAAPAETAPAAPATAPAPAPASDGLVDPK